MKRARPRPAVFLRTGAMLGSRPRPRAVQYEETSDSSGSESDSDTPNLSFNRRMLNPIMNLDVSNLEKRRKEKLSQLRRNDRPNYQRRMIHSLQVHSNNPSRLMAYQSNASLVGAYSRFRLDFRNDDIKTNTVFFL